RAIVQDRQRPDVFVTWIEEHFRLSVGSYAIDLAVRRTTGVDGAVTRYGQGSDVELSRVVQQRSAAIRAHAKDSSVMACPEVNVSLTIDGTGPDESLLCVKYFSNIRR